MGNPLVNAGWSGILDALYVAKTAQPNPGQVMPTPFMHMALDQRLINDSQLPASIHDFLQAEWGAFLLGSVAPDARVSSGISRVDTHFFEYRPVVEPPPAVAMLNRYPELQRAHVQDNTRAAFVAGYAGHLAMDEIWCTELLFPCFINVNGWQPQEERNLALHLLLGYLDQRDRAQLPNSDYPQLAAATPDRWLPFIGDAALIGWRDLLAEQLAPGAASQTLEILSKRVALSPARMAEYVNSTAEMQARVWANVPPERIPLAEEAMYAATFKTIVDYLTGRLVQAS